MKETLTALARVALRWALWSPRRLAAVAVAVLVGVFALGAVSGHGGKRSTATARTTTSATTQAPTTEAPTTEAPTTEVTTTPAPTTTAATAVVKPSATAVATTRPAPPPAVAVATRFVRAWTTPRPDKAWLAALAPLVTKRYLAELRTVNPANVPAVKITGPGKVVRRVQNVTSVEIPTSRTPLYINVTGGLVDNVATA